MTTVPRASASSLYSFGGNSKEGCALSHGHRQLQSARGDIRTLGVDHRSIERGLGQDPRAISASTLRVSPSPRGQPSAAFMGRPVSCATVALCALSAATSRLDRRSSSARHTAGTTPRSCNSLPDGEKMRAQVRVSCPRSAGVRWSAPYPCHSSSSRRPEHGRGRRARRRPLRPTRQSGR